MYLQSVFVTPFAGISTRFLLMTTSLRRLCNRLFAIVTFDLPKEERALIQGIRRLAGRSRNPAVVEGIGDDCAILRVAAGHELLVTTDLCVEDVHFRRKWHPAPSVGHRCLTRGLSDIAAMGGVPLACFLSLALPTNLPQSWVDGFLL